MQGAFRCVIFTLACAYAHAQCCSGSNTRMDGSVAVMPKTKTSCTAGLFEGYGGNDVSNEWKETCPSGTSCLGIQCSGKCPTPQGFAALIPCTKVSIVLQECTSAAGLAKMKSTTEASFRAKNLDATCDGAASSTLVSWHLLIVSSCVALVAAVV